MDRTVPDRRPPVRTAVVQLLQSKETVRQRIRSLLLAVTFWCAITLPFLYLPLLATGLETQGTLAVFLFLVVLNALTLVVGHAHSVN